MRYFRFSVALLSLAVISCQKKEAPKEAENPSADVTIVRDAIFSKLLTPGEAAAKLQSMGADFNASLLNDAGKWSGYVTAENKTASNLGVYLSDLNYCVAYQQKEHIKNYFDASLQLASTLGAKKEMLDFITNRFKKNIDQNDSIKNYLSQLDSGAVSFLKDTEREHLAGITISAYYIENLHIALGIIESYPKDILPSDARTVILVPAFRLVLSQKDNVKTIYRYLDATANKDNPNYLYYKNAMQELIATYDKLNVDDAIKNNKVHELLTDSVVKELSDKVNQIRDKVVSI
jgi:hypothetical protein